MGRKRLSESEKIRKLIEHGYSTKYIITHVGCKPQAVYNARYYINKTRPVVPAGVELAGIGALPIPSKAEPRPKRKYTRRVNTGTGINPGAFVETSTAYLAPPTPTLWERIKGFFRG